MAVEVVRGGLVESFHHGSVAVTDRTGDVRLALGHVTASVYPRSAFKPIQVLPLLESGAAETFGISDTELTLACASHNGEPLHAEAIAAWMSRVGLTEDALACGTHWSLSENVARTMAGEGAQPSIRHNTCSGKHVAMLTTAVHQGEEINDYEAPDHPVQIRVRVALSEMTGRDLKDADPAIDGCSVPAYAFSLIEIARAFAALSDVGKLGKVRAASCHRIVKAMTTNPFMVAGTDRFCTKVMEAAVGTIVMKTGAEGVMAATLPALGIGVAIKIDDGARRAAEVALAAVLLAIETLPEKARACLHGYAKGAVRNWHGKVTGTVRAASGFPQ